MDLPDGVISGEPARLIPVVADSSREVRATSILLATMEAVPQLAKALLGSIGQNVGARTTVVGYSEVVFSAQKNGETLGRPDGYLVLERGSKQVWSALIEAKIGRGEIDEAQLRRYVALAKSHSIRAVITISNQFVAVPTHHPIRLPRNLVKSTPTYHWSWMNILTEAMLLLNSDDIESTTQRYLLKELIRYFSHQSVGVSTHDRMNTEWRQLVSDVQAGVQLSKSSQDVTNSVMAWHEETRDLALLLTRLLNQPVGLRLSRAEQSDAGARLKGDVDLLATEHRLRCSFNVPNAASPIEVSCDLRRRSVSISMSLQAPADRHRTSSRINWLLRQLAKTDPQGIHVRARWPGRTPPTQVSLETLRLDVSSIAPSESLLPQRFEVLLIKDLAGRFSGSKTFLEDVEAALPYFYEQVGQYLREFKPKPPRVSKADRGPELRGDSEASSETVDIVSDQVNVDKQPELLVERGGSHAVG